MANYGPPGDGGPSPWHEPSHGGQPYGGGQGYGGGQPYYDSSDTATYPPYQGDGAESAYAGQPVPPPERGRGRGRVFAVLAAVLVLVLGGATAFYLLGQDDETPTPVAAPTPEEAPVTPAGPDDEDETPTDPPSDASSTDPRFVEPGECVRNEGPASGKPKLVISECVPKSYEVLRRFDGKTSGERDAEAKCAPVDGYTNWYFYDSELDSLDFVLCLKQRG